MKNKSMTTNDSENNETRIVVYGMWSKLYSKANTESKYFHDKKIKIRNGLNLTNSRKQKQIKPRKINKNKLIKTNMKINKKEKAWNCQVNLKTIKNTHREILSK